MIIRSGLGGLGVTLLRSVSVNLAELRRAQTRGGKGGLDLGMRNAPRGGGLDSGRLRRGGRSMKMGMVLKD